MNPLFCAHLIADFLLQPDDLVAWKQRSVGGVFMHSFVHLVVMAALILPFNFSLWPIIFAVSAMHAVIDQWKISYQKRYTTFVSSFLVDQVSHLLAITAFFLMMPFTIGFWNTEAGIGITILLLISSWLLGLWHLGIFEGIMPKFHGRKFTTALLVTITFVMFLIPAILLSTF